MNYMYFDIECCDGNHICSFGYVVVNDKFDILKKEDILINPKMPFRLGRANFDPYISLAYEEEEFRRNPNFNARYDLIKQLLTKPNQIILGHSVTSDLNFLDMAYTRYGKKRVEVNVYDTQKIYADNFAPGKCPSLESILKDLNIDMGGLVAHKSCDDAELTMLAVKEMFRRLNISVAELLRRNSACVVSYRLLEDNKKRSLIKKRIKSLNKTYKDKIGADKIYFSASIGLNNVDHRIELIEKIYRNGYAVTLDITDSTYIVCNNNIAKRENNLLAAANKEKPQLISYNQLMSMLTRK